MTEDATARAGAAAAALQQAGWELGAAFWAGVADMQLRAFRFGNLWLEESLAELERQERWMVQVGARVGRAQEAGREMTLAVADAMEHARTPVALAQDVAMPLAREAGARAASLTRELADRALRLAMSRVAFRPAA